MRFERRFSFHFSVFILLQLLLPSCSSSQNINEAFEKKYGKEIKKIKVARAPIKESNQQVVFITPPTEEEITASIAAESDYYPYVDVSKFGEKMPQHYLPNAETYEQTKANNPANSLPSNMFEIAYNTTLYPAFRKTGTEFDRIEIPPTDVYGVKTEMSEKPYLLAGVDSLQKAIDQVSAEKTADDIEFSHILVKEQKQLHRQEKMEKIFGKNSIELASLEKPAEKKEEKKESKENLNLPQSQANKAVISGFIRSIVKN
jgi:hypothetical protein